MPSAQCSCVNLTHRVHRIVRCSNAATKRCLGCAGVVCSGCAKNHHPLHGSMVKL